MAQWEIELSEVGIQFKPHLALKEQVLSNILVNIPQREMEPDCSDWWTHNVDGASRQTRADLGVGGNYRIRELKPLRSKSRQLGSPSLTVSYINGPWAGPTLSASLTRRDNTCWQDFIMGYTKITQATGRWHIELIPKATIGRPCVWISLLC